MKCTKCRQEKDDNYFKGKNNKITKTCSDCRKKSKQWGGKNKKRVQLYNKYYNRKHKKDKIQVVYAKLVNNEHDEWIRFVSQAQAALELNVHNSTICKVLKGHAHQTGGYVFKIVEENVEDNIKENIDWNTIKNENNITDNVKGFPSPHRTLHETIDGVTGKKCCTCKEWKPLTNYNFSCSHWEKLRVDCKDCLVAWRKKNREELNRKALIYEQERKKRDPAFKLLKTLRSRLGSALKSQNVEKQHRTMDLIGQTPAFVRDYLESKFTEGMSWDNHGKWHIDHIKACCKFDLTKEEEQRRCFHYTNLQPLWAKDNLSKGSK